MTFKLVINDLDYEYTFLDYALAIEKIEEVYGYKGQAWDWVVASGDIHQVYEFLLDDGVDADLFNAN